MSRRRVQDAEAAPKSLWQRAYDSITVFVTPDQLGYVVAFVTATVVRAMGVTVRSGETALLFSFGRARQELQPGFRLLLPFLQVIRRMPSRSRTLDLPSQRVVTHEGLVFHADANLVYRVVDIRKAVVEIDHLEKGMLQILGLAVQAVLRRASRERMSEPEYLERELERELTPSLEPWGVRVEQVGFTSVTPSSETLRLTQLARTTLERVRALEVMETGRLDSAHALGLLGARQRFRRRTREYAALAAQHAGRRRVRAALVREGVPTLRIGTYERRGALRFPGERSSTFRRESREEPARKGATSTKAEERRERTAAREAARREKPGPTEVGTGRGSSRTKRTSARVRPR